MPLEDNAYGLRDIQRALLAMALEIDRICRLHGIEYSIYGGTMLGAVRESGFIPWDDDLDLVFTANALKAFIRVFPSESADYTVTETDTWVRRVVPRKAAEGFRPFIDLFHYEPVSADPSAQRRKLFRLRMLQGMIKEDIDYSLYSPKNRVLVLATHLLGLPFSKAVSLAGTEAQARGWRAATVRFCTLRTIALRGSGTSIHARARNALKISPLRARPSA